MTVLSVFLYGKLKLELKEQCPVREILWFRVNSLELFRSIYDIRLSTVDRLFQCGLLYFMGALLIKLRNLCMEDLSPKEAGKRFSKTTGKHGLNDSATAIMKLVAVLAGLGQPC